MDGDRDMFREGREDMRSSGGERLCSVDWAVGTWWGGLECQASLYLERADPMAH